MTGRGLLLCGGIGVLLAYGCYQWLNRPVEGFHDPRPMRLLGLFKAAGYFMSVAASYIGGGDQIAYERKWFSDSSLFALAYYSHDKSPWKRIDVHGVGVDVFYGDLNVVEPRSDDDNAMTYPAIIYYHGGGFVFPMLEFNRQFLMELSRNSSAIIFAIDYRLAPEYPCPHAFDDSYAVTTAILKNTKRYGVDESRVILMGDSAGGSLTAAVANKLVRDKDIGGTYVMPLGQVLIAPVLQAIRTDLPSYKVSTSYESLLTPDMMFGFLSAVTFGSMKRKEVFSQNIPWTQLSSSIYGDYVSNMSTKSVTRSIDEERAVMMRMADAIDSDEASRNLVNQDCFPLMAHNLEGTLPTLMIVYEHDILRDDGVLYAQRLKLAAVNVKILSYDSFHCASLLCGTPFSTEDGERSKNDLFHFVSELLTVH